MSKRSADPMIPVSFKVKRLLEETHDTFTLELVSANGNKGFKFLPGQFNMMYLFGMGEVPLSISGDPKKKEKYTKYWIKRRA